MKKNEFGGLWTRKKLEILKDYLGFYTTALRNKFVLHYVDAFAGTGSQSKKPTEKQGELLPLEDLKGSVITALETNPGFHYYHFNDLDPEHVLSLEEIKSKHPDKKITITNLDANLFVKNFCLSLRKGERTVLFVDPFSTQFEWVTLKYIAKSEKIDLWLLFPLSAALRMTPKDGARPEWKTKIDALLGTSKWEEALYKQEEKPVNQDLFDSLSETESTERINYAEMQIWVKRRLEEEFSFVAEPVLLTNNNSPLFSFFFAVANKDKKAWGLAQRVSNDIMKKHQ